MEARISWGVHSGLDPDPYEEMWEGKGKGREGETVIASWRTLLQKGRVTKCLHSIEPLEEG